MAPFPLLSPLFEVHPRRLLRVPALRLTARSRGRTTLALEGLACGLCARRTELALATLPDVTAARVELRSGRAELRHDPAAPPSAQALRAALEAVVVAPRARRALAALAGGLAARWRRAG